MHAGFEFTGQGLVHYAVSLDAALAPEGFRHDIDPEMGFAAWSMAGMTLVVVRFVDHLEALWREGFGQLVGYGIAGRHGARLAAVMGGGQQYGGRPSLHESLTGHPGRDEWQDVHDDLEQEDP